MRTLRFAINNKLSPNDGHIGQLWSSSNPKFHAFLPLRAKHKLSSLVVVGRECLDLFGKTAVMKLSEAETAQIFESERIIYIFLMLGVALEEKDGLGV